MVTTLVFGLGALSQYVFGSFVAAIPAETGWNPGTVSAGFALFVALSAVGIALLGMLVDRFGPRNPTIISICLTALILASASRSASPEAFIILMGLAGLCYGAGSGIAFSQVIAVSLEKRRGLAFGLGTAGTGLGGILLPQLSLLALPHLGWRDSLLVLAAAIALVTLSAAVVGLPASGAGHQTRPDKIGLAAFRRLIALRNFRVFAVAMGLVAAATVGMMVQAIAIMTDKGLSIAVAAKLMSLTAAISIFGRLLGGYLMDLIHAPIVAGSIFLIGAAGVLGLMAADTQIGIAAGMIVLGFVVGAESDVISYMTSRYFPAEDFGKCYGIIVFIFWVSSGIGILILQQIYLLNKSHSPAIIVAASFQIIASILLYRMGPYQR